MAKITDIQSYIKNFSAEEKNIMESLLKIIHSTVKCDETIAYNMPALRYNDKIVCCFAMNKNHLGYYPYSGGVISKMQSELEKFTTTKGAVHFAKDAKLPVGIIKKLLKARIQEIDMA